MIHSVICHVPSTKKYITKIANYPKYQEGSQLYIMCMCAKQRLLPQLHWLMGCLDLGVLIVGNNLIDSKLKYFVLLMLMSSILKDLIIFEILSFWSEYLPPE